MLFSLTAATPVRIPLAFRTGVALNAKGDFILMDDFFHISKEYAGIIIYGDLRPILLNFPLNRVLAFWMYN